MPGTVARDAIAPARVAGGDAATAGVSDAASAPCAAADRSASGCSICAGAAAPARVSRTRFAWPAVTLAALATGAGAASGSAPKPACQIRMAAACEYSLRGDGTAGVPFCCEETTAAINMSSDPAARFDGDASACAVVCPAGPSLGATWLDELAGCAAPVMLKAAACIGRGGTVRTAARCCAAKTAGSGFGGRPESVVSGPSLGAAASLAILGGDETEGRVAAPVA